LTFLLTKEGTMKGRRTITLARFAALFVVAGAFACDGTDPDPDPNRAPVAVGGIPPLTLTEGESYEVDASQFFTDPDGDQLSYSATSSNTSVLAVSVSGSNVTATAVAAGTAEVTVTATDPDGLSASHTISVMVQAANQAPVVSDTIPPQTLTEGDTVTIDASGYFSDPDGDELSYEAVSSDPEIATAVAMDAMIEIVAQAVGTTAVTVSAMDPEGLTAAQQVMVTVEGPPPTVADSIPTHDMIVDSMVTLDVSPYFEGDELIYTAMSSDEMVAAAAVDGSTVTTTGVGAVEDSISVAMLSVTATNESGSSVTQDSIMVRVHQEEYDTLPGLSVNEDGTLLAELSPGNSVPLSLCLQVPPGFVVGGQPFTVFWSEWQRAVGSGWITAQDNDKAHVSRVPEGTGSICPIKIEDEKFPPGVYRLVGHVQIGEESGFYKTPTFEKKPAG
jgi:VCBS repeat-containing protein